MINHQILSDKTKIHSSYLNEDIINLATQTFQIPDKFSYKVVEISEDYTARPDLISLQMYGTDAFTDIICKLNGISNPFELNEGDRLIVPNFEDLHKFYYISLNSEIDTKEINKDNDSSLFNNIPKAKAFNDKRTPNEAIINDKRFRIDVKNRVIIY